MDMWMAQWQAEIPGGLLVDRGVGYSEKSTLGRRTTLCLQARDLEVVPLAPMDTFLGERGSTLIFATRLKSLGIQADDDHCNLLSLNSLCEVALVNAHLHDLARPHIC